MPHPVIEVHNLGKQYRLGVIGGGTLREDVNRWWAKLRGKPDPLGPVEGASHGSASPERVWAVRGVSFEVAQGEILGIIGRNGAGKSTLLKILSRITAPTLGTVRLRGRVGSLLEVGTGFHPELTGRENIYLNGTILGMTRAEVDRKLEEIIEFAEIARFADTPVKRYSSGMYVRLAFAVAAHLEPEILVVDEVLAVGDAQFQRKCLEKMGSVSKEGRTVLFVSHNMAAVLKLCTRALLLQGGELEFDGATEATVSCYQEQATPFELSSSCWVAHLREPASDAPVGPVEISGVELLDRKGTLLRQIRSCDPLVIRVHYRANGTVRAPAFNVIVRSLLGVELIRLNTQPISGYELGPLRDRGYVDLELATLPLTGGRYSIDVGVSRARVEWIQRIEHAVALNVEAWDVYGSGMPMDASKGMLVVSHKWSHG